MRSLEKDLPGNYELKHLIWLWYIDDIFLIWTHGEESLEKFVEYANFIYPTIKSNSDQSRQAAFLDTVVQIVSQTTANMYKRF